MGILSEILSSKIRAEIFYNVKSPPAIIIINQRLIACALIASNFQQFFINHFKLALHHRELIRSPIILHYSVAFGFFLRVLLGTWPCPLPEPELPDSFLLPGLLWLPPN